MSQESLLDVNRDTIARLTERIPPDPPLFKGGDRMRHPPLEKRDRLFPSFDKGGAGGLTLGPRSSRVPRGIHFDLTVLRQFLNPVSTVPFARTLGLNRQSRLETSSQLCSGLAVTSYSVSEAKPRRAEQLSRTLERDIVVADIIAGKSGLR